MTTGRTMARALDQFYTVPEVAQSCVEQLRSFLGPRGERAHWVEPSAGAGAFLEFLPPSVHAIDIAPRDPRIARVDFLTWRFENPGECVVVGNPPFGKNASLALKFFNHAASFATVIAFVLPRTFQKQSMIGKLNPVMHLRAEHALPRDAFVFAGEPYNVPTVFQIWERDRHPRPTPLRKLTHPDFGFVCAELADFAFQRVGARAGLVSREGLRKSAQSHYFIKAKRDPESLFRRLSAIDWNSVKSRTAGNPSIGKAELVALYETEDT